MGKRFDDYRQAIAEAPGRLDELRLTLGQFQGKSISGRAFYISQKGDLALGRVHATIAETNGSFKIQFATITKNRGEPYSVPDVTPFPDWLLSPAVENDQFKWTVAEPHNQAFTNGELADEVAVYMAGLDRRIRSSTSNNEG